MKKIALFSGQQLESIAQVLADTGSGLTGSEIGHILAECRIPDVSPTMTKWKRLYNAFVEYQNVKQFGNHVVGFIHKAMNPVRYTSQPHAFAQRRDDLNQVLAFAGMHLGDDGKLRPTDRASNISEAKEKANRLHSALDTRNVHADVLRFCSAELLQENYFHAVFEAMKSVAAKIRQMSGLTSDGADLVRDAFSIGKDCNPLLAINPLATETDQGEQRGFVNLLIGLFGVIRNPLAHNAKIEWEMNEQDALDVLTTASLIHRKLDKAHRFRE
jgi:uncharacterized protein (TIGR02391 family)